MRDVTRILSAIEQGDPHATEKLLPLVSEELRKLAAQKMTQEKPGQTLQATALVHEATSAFWTWKRLSSDKLRSSLGNMSFALRLSIFAPLGS